jgi:membrane-bound serine protease (ClpP class)
LAACQAEEKKMDLLLNPNLAYLLMMGSILLALLALLTPGTGVLELGAVIALLLVGVQLFNLPINLWALGVILVGAALYAVAIVRRGDPVLLASGIVVIFIGAGLVYRGENSLIGVSPWLILLVSVGEGSILWVVTQKVLHAAVSPPLQDMNYLIGSQAETRTFVQDEGTVYADGEEWSARSETPIPAQTAVQIIGREGFTLLVAPWERSHSPTDIDPGSSPEPSTGG